MASNHPRLTKQSRFDSRQTDLQFQAKPTSDAVDRLDASADIPAVQELPTPPASPGPDDGSYSRFISPSRDGRETPDAHDIASPFAVANRNLSTTPKQCGQVGGSRFTERTLGLLLSTLRDLVTRAAYPSGGAGDEHGSPDATQHLPAESLEPGDKQNDPPDPGQLGSTYRAPPIAGPPGERTDYPGRS